MVHVLAVVIDLPEKYKKTREIRYINLTYGDLPMPVERDKSSHNYLYI